MATTIFIDPEKVRLRCGFSRTQWAGLMAGVPADRADQRAWEIGKAFDRFLDRCRAAVDYEFRDPGFRVDGTSYLSTIQAARALGIGEFHLANLRDRGKLAGTKLGRRSGFTREALMNFLDVDRHPETRQSALTVSFLRWFELEEQERSRRRRKEPALA